jgi:site-specific recombinase XerD
LERRQFAAHTIASSTLDLRVFFPTATVPRAQVSFREVDHVVEQQHPQGRAWATINRRLHALQHFFAFCLEQQIVAGNPGKPSHFVRRGRPLPKALSQEQVQRLFALIAHPMDRALFLVMLRCGLRVSEVAKLKLEQIDWEQQALHIMQGKGRKERRVYLSPAAVASVQQCLAHHPGARAQGYVFWHRNRTQQPLSVKAIQKQMERYAKAAGITASWHSLRQTFASNLLEQGAEVVAIRDFLGQSQIASSARYANVSSQKIKQEYMRTMQKISSCKFFGDSLRLCGSLLGEPQLLPLLIAFDPFEDAQGFAACRTPPHSLVLLARPDDLIDPFFHPATAHGFARPLAATVIDALRLMLLEVCD